MRINDTWFGMEGEDDDKPFLIRGREEIDDFRKKGKHEMRVDMVFNYVTQDEHKTGDIIYNAGKVVLTGVVFSFSRRALYCGEWKALLLIKSKRESKDTK